MEQVLPLEQRHWRPASETPWYRRHDIVGNTLYDTPCGRPFGADEDHLIPEINEIWDEAFTGEVLVPQMMALRFLPYETYLPTDHVIAIITGAQVWGKAINVSWMQMGEDPLFENGTPLQHKRKGAVIVSIDDDYAAFDVISPEETDEPCRIGTDCVTDLRLIFSPVPKPAEQLPAGCQIDG